VEGVVKDAAGQGIPGVRIRLGRATQARSRMTRFFDDPGDLNFSLSELEFSTVTDEAGHFQLRNTPPERRVLLEAKHSEWEPHWFAVDTGQYQTATTLTSPRLGKTSYPVMRSPLEISLEPHRSVVVRIRDHNGAAVRGGAVSAYGAAGSGAWEAVEAGGVARLQFREPGAYNFHYGADPLDPQLQISREITINDVQPAGVVDLQLPKPRWLTGRVVDSESGEPLTGVYVSYSSTPPEGAADRPVSSLGTTDVTGRFRLPVVPGPGTVVAAAFHGTYGYLSNNGFSSASEIRDTQLLAIEVSATGDVSEIELKLYCGLRVRGRVTGVNGQPVANVIVRGSDLEKPFRNATTTTDGEGRFVLTGMSPNVTSYLTVASDAGAVQQVIEADNDATPFRVRDVTVDLRLQPGIALSGRVTRSGQPEPGVRLKFFRSLPTKENTYNEFCELLTNADGEYRVSGLTPRDGYYFVIHTSDGSHDPAWRYQPNFSHRIDPNETRTEIRLPDVKLISHGQLLAGIVVDREGKPVPGITVSAQRANGGMLSRRSSGPPPWTTTGDDGRFELPELPDEPIDLMAHRRNPKGGRILYPAIVPTIRGQTDIRILLDPELQQEIEDLDAPQ
jgi:hypothetical protein